MLTEGYGKCLANVMSKARHGFWHSIGLHPAGAFYVDQYFDGVESADLTLLMDIANSSLLQNEVKTSCGIYFFTYKLNNISSHWFCFDRGKGRLNVNFFIAFPYLTRDSSIGGSFSIMSFD
jgi:hypothetical protein